MKLTDFNKQYSVNSSELKGMEARLKIINSEGEAMQSGKSDFDSDKLNKIIAEMENNIAQQKLTLKIGKAIEQYSDILKVKLTHVDECLKTYHRTIDKRNSDLTVRETEQVAACKSMNLYPPAK